MQALGSIYYSLQSNKTQWWLSKLAFPIRIDFLEERTLQTQLPAAGAEMSNSLIVIMCLCHLLIISMIKDEIFTDAALLT